MNNPPTVLWVAVVILITLPVVYILVRVAALAWFGTKREQAHKLVKELQTNERNVNEDPKAATRPQRHEPQRP
jgi:flagellar basal body-associated protein FliL